MTCETAFNLTEKFGWSGKKYIFTVMENVGQFSPDIGNSVFNLFSNVLFNDNFLGFWMVNHFKTLHVHSRSLK